MTGPDLDEDDQDDQDEPSVAIPALIDRMDAFAADLPLEAVLVPVENAWGGMVGVRLTDLFADVPGQGAGSAYMNRLCEEAGRHGVAVYVQPACLRSKAFYERFGFEGSERVFGALQKLPPPPTWVMAP